jgi:hypothetical protein
MSKRIQYDTPKIIEDMITKTVKRLFFAANALIAATPFFLMVYLFKTWVDDGEFAHISFYYGLYHWVGINPAIEGVTYDNAGMYKLYLYLLKLPLLLWLFILSAPSLVYVARNVKD